MGSPRPLRPSPPHATRQTSAPHAAARLSRDLTPARPETGFFDRVYALVEEIPPGQVATYGQVAALLGITRGARAVGWALRALDEPRAATVPWHRVVGAGGRISPRAGSGPAVQRRRLRAEGVRFRNGRIDMARHGIFHKPVSSAPPGAA